MIKHTKGEWKWREDDTTNDYEWELKGLDGPNGEDVIRLEDNYPGYPECGQNLIACVKPGDARLIAMSRTAPHECDDPACPGNINRRKLALFDEMVEAMKGMLRHINSLASESQGIAGLHHNGDVAPWDEVLEGGEYEEWLGEAMYEARTILTKADKLKGGQ